MRIGKGEFVGLGVSALTRRKRLARIASAERDRRAGRIELALAVLGGGTEWPARIVLSLAKLAEDEGAETRSILERGLDEWAAEIGLDPLDTPLGQAMPEPGIDVGELDSPIDHDELERAFAEAETQVDEMHDVNSVAARVLQEEPVGLAELSGDELMSEDAHEREPETSEPEAPETDAAAADVPNWFGPMRGEGFRVNPAGSPEEDLSEVAASCVADEGRPSRGVILSTLGRWLDNLEESRARRAQ